MLMQIYCTSVCKAQALVKQIEIHAESKANNGDEPSQANLKTDWLIASDGSRNALNAMQSHCILAGNLR